MGVSTQSTWGIKCSPVIVLLSREFIVPCLCGLTLCSATSNLSTVHTSTLFITEKSIFTDSAMKLNEEKKRDFRLKEKLSCTTCLRNRIFTNVWRAPLPRPFTRTKTSKRASCCNSLEAPRKISPKLAEARSVPRSTSFCVVNLVPRSQYTSGKGSSAVGLTAYVTKDPETKQLVLQTGALVLADNGICCIDEFDKMSDATRNILHEVMEQQTLSIAKAGIICQLNARTSVLAGANPIESQWNKDKTVIENIQLPHTLLSRFDLIFLMLDPQDELYDKRLARHLVSLYYSALEEAESEFMELDVLRDYIAYGKEHINPMLNDAASVRLIESYVEMRRIGSGRGQVTAYPRQLESLIRLAKAHAKVRYSDVVEVDDVEEAYRLHREALKQSATDPMSGKIDVNILTTGLSANARKKRGEISQALRKMIESKGKVSTMNYQKAFNEFKQGSSIMITREMFEDALKDLQDDGMIVVAGRSSIRICHQ